MQAAGEAFSLNMPIGLNESSIGLMAQAR